MSLLWVQELEVRLGGKERRGMFGSEALPAAGLDLYPSPPAALSKTPVSRAARPVLPCKVCFSIYSEGLASVSLCAPSPCPGDGAGEHPLVSKGWEEMGRDGKRWAYVEELASRGSAARRPDRPRTSATGPGPLVCAHGGLATGLSSYQISYRPATSYQD